MAYTLAFLILLFANNALSQPATLEPVAGCVQFKVDFESTDIDENCQFVDPAMSDAVWGSSFDRAECKALGGTLLLGQYKTNSLLCPDDGHLYTACCTRYDCASNLQLWQDYCEARDMSFSGYCNGATLVTAMGCVLDFNPAGGGDAWVSEETFTTQVSALNYIIHQNYQMNQDNATNTGGIISMLETLAWQNENNAQRDADAQENIINGITSISDISRQQLEAMKDTRQQTIKARFEQAGLLGNIELITEEMLIEQQTTNAKLDENLLALQQLHADLNGGIELDQTATISAINSLNGDVNDNHRELMDAQGNPESFEEVTVEEENTAIPDYSGTMNEYDNYYENELESAVQLNDLPDYESLAEQLLAPYAQIGNATTCPDFSFEATLPNALGGTQMIDLKTCELTIFGTQFWAFIRTILQVLTHSACAYLLYLTTLQIMAGNRRIGFYKD